MLYVDLILLLQTTCSLNRKKDLVFIKNINNIKTRTGYYFVSLQKHIFSDVFVLRGVKKFYWFIFLKQKLC